MRTLIIIFLFAFQSVSAQEFERKIIIRNEKAFYITIDPEFQLATLHICNLNDPLSNSKQFILPAGRSLSEPINPLAWDISGDYIFVINFMDNALNDKYQSIKKFRIDSLKIKDSEYTVQFHLSQTLYQPFFAYNEPYKFMIDRSPVILNLFFDIQAMTDSSLQMVISNNGEQLYWFCTNGSWSHRELVKISFEHYFSILENGTVFTNENEYLIVNKNTNKILRINKTDVTPSQSLNQIIKQKAKFINE